MVEQLVLAEQARTLYDSVKVTALTSVLSCVVLVALFWRTIDHSRLFIWSAAVIAALSPLSLVLYWYYRRHSKLPADARHWLNLQGLRFFLGTLAYGSAGVVLFVPDSLTYQLILFAFLFALSATLMAEAAQYRPLYLVTFPPLLLPFVVRAMIDSDGTTKLLALLAGTGLIYTSVTTRNLSKLMGSSLAHRFNNEILVEQLQAQKQLAEGALGQAEEANRAKSRFLAAASHDLRQPLHALGLFVSAMKPHVVGDQGMHILERVESTVRSTEVMFNAMLDVSRLDAGVLVPNIRPIPLAPLLTQLKAEYTPLAEAKDLRLRTRLGEYSVVSDPTLLERVIRNYLGNAIRYTQRGGVLLACRQRNGSLSIEVWDTGHGIPKNRQTDIYEEFYQLHNPERDRSKGLGLGLAIVKRISLLLSHPIRLSSRIGRGSMFSIEVPMAPNVARDAAHEPDGILDETVLVGACVLVIDDEADAREAIEVLLKQWGCRVLSADSAESALELLRKHDVTLDAVLSDYRLRAGRTGIAAIQAIEREFGTTSAALITGDTAPDRLKEATDSGYKLMHKPLNPSHLKQTLCAMLAKNRAFDP